MVIGLILLLLLPGTKLPLVESFGLLNDLFPFPSILDAGYPVFDLQLATSTAALRLTVWPVKARGRELWKKKITWSSRLGVVRRASYPSMENICKDKNSQQRNGTGRFNGCRRKRVQRNTRNKLCIGYWFTADFKCIYLHLANKDLR